MFVAMLSVGFVAMMGLNLWCAKGHTEKYDKKKPWEPA